MSKLNLNAGMFALHRWFGLVCGVVLLLVGLSGSLLVFSDELKAGQFARVGKATPRGTELPLETLFSRVRQQEPDAWPYGISLKPRRADAFAELFYERGSDYGFFLVDPYTGRVAADLDSLQVFGSLLLRFHYELLVRPWGDLVVALTGFLFVGSAATGVWVYRHAIFAPFRRGVRFREGARRIFADLHLLVGVGAVGFNLMLGLTGVFMMLYVFSPSYFARAMQDRQRVPRPEAMLAVDELVTRARRALPGFEPDALYLPMRAGGLASVYGNVPGTAFWLGGRSSGRSHVDLDASTGAVRAVVNITRASWSAQMAAVFTNYISDNLEA